MSENQEIGQQKVTPAFNNLIDSKDFKFSFRKDEFGNTRPAVEVALPVPSVEGVAEIFNAGGKGLEIVMRLVQDAIGDHVRSLLNDSPEITTANFPYAQATWEALVNTPESERKGRGIPKELWKDFGEDYVKQMPSVTGKTVDQVTLAVKLLLNKFQSVKSRKDVIGVLKTQLAVYLTSTPNAEQYVDCVKFLDEKADALLQADDTALLDNL